MASVTTTPQGNAEVGMSADEARTAGRTPKQASRVEIEPTENGGFIVTQFYKQPMTAKSGPMPYNDPTKHAYADLAGVVTCLQQAFPNAAAPAAADDEPDDTETETAGAPSQGAY